jgi:hypothetical protein
VAEGLLREEEAGGGVDAALAIELLEQEAAARSMVGPPTSTFSTASSKEQPFATLSSNG